MRARLIAKSIGHFSIGPASMNQRMSVMITWITPQQAKQETHLAAEGIEQQQKHVIPAVYS